MPDSELLDRDLDWQGCFNVRDLGGFETADGAVTRSGAAVRADSLHKLTPRGWYELVRYGVRTVIDLRNPFELEADLAPRPDALSTSHLPLDGREDTQFWSLPARVPQFGTPLYYRAHLERMPERSGAVLRAIAHAPPGGVAFHCVGGRDRTGQIAILLLALVGAEPDAIVADYERTDELLARRPEPNLSARAAAYLAEQQTSTGAEIVSLIEWPGLWPALEAGGLTPADTRALRARLTDQ